MSVSLFLQDIRHTGEDSSEFLTRKNHKHIIPQCLYVYQPQDFFVSIECWGFAPTPGHKGLFEKSPLETEKLCQNKVVQSAGSFCGFSRGFLQKAPWSKVWNGSSNIFWQIKKRGFLRVFCKRWMLRLSAPNLDAKDFSWKVLWNLKSFAKMKWYSRWEILLPTFLIRKVWCVFI